jgi:hypothetical protein
LAFHSGREADHSPPSSVEVKEWVELYFHSPNTPSSRGDQGEHRDNFTFTFFILFCYFSLVVVISKPRIFFNPDLRWHNFGRRVIMKETNFYHNFYLYIYFFFSTRNDLELPCEMKRICSGMHRKFFMNLYVLCPLTVCLLLKLSSFLYAKFLPVHKRRNDEV